MSLIERLPMSMPIGPGRRDFDQPTIAVIRLRKSV
jgi:hypothetical protein